MLAIQVRGGCELAERLQHDPFEALGPRGVQQLQQQPASEARAPQLGIEEEESHARDAVALVRHCEAAHMPTLALDDPDRLGVAWKASQRSLGHRRGDVRFHAGIQAVLACVKAAVVFDDRSEVPGAKVSPDGRCRHGSIVASQ